MPDERAECAILTNHVHTQARAAVCGGCYQMAMTSIQEGEDEIDRLEASLADLERQLDHERTLRLCAEERARALEAALLACYHFALPERRDLKMDNSYSYSYRGFGRVRTESDPWEAAGKLLWPREGD